MGKSKDLTGQRFGRLTVLSEYGRDKSRSILWLCKCECGKEHIVTGSNLRNKQVKSCGCLLLDFNKKNVNKLYGWMDSTDRKDKTRVSTLGKQVRKTNSSGAKGVHWDKSRSKWAAQITFQGKTHNLGRFANKQDAINAREEAEEKYFKPILEKYGKSEESDK